MAFFDDLKVKAAELTQVGVAKSKQLAEMARFEPGQQQRGGQHPQGISGDRKALLRRARHGPRGRLYTALCEKVTAAKINIEENKAHIAALKAEESEGAADAPVMETVVPPEEPAVELGDPQAEEPTVAPAEPVVPEELSEAERPDNRIEHKNEPFSYLGRTARLFLNGMIRMPVT